MNEVEVCAMIGGLGGLLALQLTVFSIGLRVGREREYLRWKAFLAESGIEIWKGELWGGETMEVKGDEERVGCPPDVGGM